MRISQTYQRHLLLIAVIIVVAGFVAASDALHTRTEEILVVSEAIIAQSPLLGMLIFVLLGAASAMLAFFSSAIFVPLGIYAWGATVCLLLLWLGWFLGGVMAFGVGRYLGRSVAAMMIGDERISKFEDKLSQHARFIHILLFQAAVPSEIPGYVLGTLRYRFSLFAIALAMVELPYAIGTVFLGVGFLERNAVLLIGVGIAGVVASALAYHAYRRYVRSAAVRSDHRDEASLPQGRDSP